MSTYRDLLLPDQASIWRELRGLRVRPPGAASNDPNRASTFQSSLEQAQQFMAAAEGAGYATRPLQLFYALSQGGRAIAAVSKFLPVEILVPDKQNDGAMKAHDVPWQLKGHGITAPHTSVNRVDKIIIQAGWTGLMPGVALALGVECLRPDEKIKIGDIWPALPESSSVPLATQSDRRALSIASVTRWARDLPNCNKILIGNIPWSVRLHCREDQLKVKDFLSHYPSLADCEYPYENHEPMGWEPAPSNLAVAPVFWGKAGEEFPDLLQATRESKGIRYRGKEDWWIFPRIGGMTSPLHPIMAWWAVLFALSMMARYEPASWSKLIGIDRSMDANAIEHILDQALRVIPVLILEAITGLIR